MSRHSTVRCIRPPRTSLTCALMLLARLATAEETHSSPATPQPPQIPPLASIETAATHARAADRGSEKKYQRRPYRPLKTYRDHPWYQPLSQFRGELDSLPIGASIVYSRGKVTEFDFQCVPRGSNGCDLSASILHQSVEGEGYHAMAEYVQPGSPYVFIKSMSDPLSESWLYCWSGRGAEPKSLVSQLKFCGVRLTFRTHNEQELTAVDDDVLTNYERVLDFLRQDLGDPERYSPNTRVIIHTPNETIRPPRQRRFRDWYWCSIDDRELAPSCESSAMLHVDLKAGVGVVLLAVRPLYEFAYAEHESNADDTSLYRLLFNDKFGGAVFPSMNSIYWTISYKAKPLSPEALKLFRLPRRSWFCDFCDEGTEAWLPPALDPHPWQLAFPTRQTGIANTNPDLSGF